MRTTPSLGRQRGRDQPRISPRAWFLPVVDTNGRLDHVLVQRRFEQPLNRALVMAGGFGRRLGELTRDKPKPLLPVGGRSHSRPRVIEQLETAGIASIHIAIHYKAEQIETFIAQRINHAEITFIEKPTARNRRCTGATFQPCRRNRFSSSTATSLTQADLTAMHEFHIRHGYDATVAVSLYAIQVPFGVIRQSPEGLLGIDEKPRITHFIAPGLYYLSAEFIALTPRNRPVDMPERSRSVPAPACASACFRYMNTGRTWAGPATSRGARGSSRQVGFVAGCIAARRRTDL